MGLNIFYKTETCRQSKLYEWYIRNNSLKIQRDCGKHHHFTLKRVLEWNY